MSLTPAIRDHLKVLAARLDAAPRGQATALVRESAAFLGWSVQTVYRQLRDSAGWSSGRRTRKDKGSTSVDADALVSLAAAQREAVRDNGKQTLFTTTGRGVFEANGVSFGVSNQQLNRLMRERKLGVAAQRKANPVQDLRAPHPNHTHEVDPSLCLVYYLRDRQYIIRDSEFYKNKLDAMARVKFKVWRYVAYDRASGSIVPWYVEAAGESQQNLFDFLMFAWGEQPGRPFHGVPKNLLVDKGSARGSALDNLLLHLEVNPLDHAPGKPRVKGGVEVGNNIVETQFESRLRFEPVDNVEQLNAAAFAWANAYNANLIPGQDSRLRRDGLAQPVARYDLWQLITAEQLRRLPPVDVCRALMAAREEERTVRPNLTITYRHPQAEGSATYSVRGLAGVNVGDKISVRSLVYGECAIQIEVPRYDGEPLIYRVEPERDFDRFGQRLSAAEIGSEFKAMPKTAIEHAADAMDDKAYPGLGDDELKAARERKVTPFGGELKAHSYLKDVAMPTYLPRNGSEIETPAHARFEMPRLDATAAMLRIVDAVGRHLTADEHAFLAARYADGVPEDQLEALIAQFKAGAEAPAPLQAVGGLRAV
ncbi:integrase [Caldimonas sp. KR1-144]|uniref:integrase n=1 Tax=Caldimonas sp. KR1-144 TaxID=3400911 RepID=UPI003C0BF457